MLKFIKDFFKLSWLTGVINEPKGKVRPSPLPFCRICGAEYSFRYPYRNFFCPVWDTQSNRVLQFFHEKPYGDYSAKQVFSGVDGITKQTVSKSLLRWWKRGKLSRTTVGELLYRLIIDYA